MKRLIALPLANKYLKKQVRKPTSGFWGFLTRKYILETNTSLEVETARAVNHSDDENVLELGFGVGDGLQYVLDNGIRNGKGVVYGVDYSEEACKWVRKSLSKDIASGKLTILNEDVAKMSIPDASIHKVFHVNCFYFWPDMTNATNEIKRVMKPGGLIVAGMQPSKLEMVTERGILESWMFDPKRYTDALEKAGYGDIREENIHNTNENVDFKLIFAKKSDVA